MKPIELLARLATTSLLLAASIVSIPPLQAHEGALLTLHSPHSFTRTVERLREAVEGRGLRLLREERDEAGSAQVYSLYFCDFDQLKRVYRPELRLGPFLPCRVTVGLRDGQVLVAAPNPAFGGYDHPDEAEQPCREMKRDLMDLLVEVVS